MSSFRVECLRSMSEIETRRADWRSLLNLDPARSIFQTPAMYLSWLRIHRRGSLPAVLWVTKEGRLVSIAPMILRPIQVRGIRLRSVEFCVPRGGVIAPEGRADIVREILRYWQDHSREWDLLRLYHLPADSGIAVEAIGAAASCGFAVQDGGTGSSELILAVERPWEDHLRQETRKFRKALFHTERTVLAMEGFGLDVLFEPEGVERSLEALKFLESASWKVERGTRLSDPERELFRALMKDESGEIQYQTSLLRAEGSLLAGLLCLRYDDRMYAFLTYYDSRYERVSPGSWLMGRLVKQCFEDSNLRELSFVGSFPGGRRWTDTVRTYRNLRMYGRAPKSRLFHALERLRFWKSEIEPDE